MWHGSRPRRWLPLLGLLFAGCDGCSRSTTPAPEATSAPKTARKTRRPPLPPLPPLRIVETQSAEEPLATTARLMVPRLAVSDPLAIALHWPTPLPAPPAPGAKVDWQEGMLDTLHVVIDGPNDLRLELTPETGAPKKRGFAGPFRSPAHAILQLDGAGVSLEYGPTRKWTTPATSNWLAPGRYRIQLQASVNVQQETRAFSTKPLAFEVVGGDRLLLSRLRSIARGAVETTLGPISRAHPHRTVEDRAGNLWMWFSYSIGGDRFDRHVNVSPSGAVIAIAERTESYCVASGTSIASPNGAISVEDLRPGDVVTGWDDVAGHPVATRVRKIVARDPTSVVQLNGLRLSDPHPVLTKRGFVPAGRVTERDWLRYEEGWRRVAHATALFAPMVVYDIGVAPPHTFIANGVVVHNKAAPTAGPADGWAFLFDRPNADGWQQRRWFGRPSPRQLPGGP